MTSPNYFEWTVRIVVAKGWVADGFNLTSERMLEAVRSILPYATDDEIGTMILRSPEPDDILSAQGYDLSTLTSDMKKELLS